MVGEHPVTFEMPNGSAEVRGVSYVARFISVWKGPALSSEIPGGKSRLSRFIPDQQRAYALRQSENYRSG